MKISKKKIGLITIFSIIILFAVLEWKWFSVLFCLFIIFSILSTEIKGIEGNK